MVCGGREIFLQSICNKAWPFFVVRCLVAIVLVTIVCAVRDHDVRAHNLWVCVWVTLNRFSSAPSRGSRRDLGRFCGTSE